MMLHFFLTCFLVAISAIHAENNDEVQIKFFNGTLDVKTLSKQTPLADDDYVLQITKSSIEKIEDGALCASSFSSIAMFDNPKLPNFTKEMFGNCPALKKLTVKNNNPDWIFESDAFSRLDNLKVLMLENQPKITGITKGTLPPSLIKLGIRQAEIHQINLEVFDEMERLEHLILSFDNLSAIEGTFKKLPRLMRLDLSSNPLMEEFPWESLKNLESLKYLNLVESGVTNFDADKIAENVPMLRTISLSGLKSAFRSCKKIVQLVDGLVARYGSGNLKVVLNRECSND